jgi:hypothetical protein
MHGLGVFQFFTEDSNFFAGAVCACEAVCLARFLRDGVAVPHWTRILKFVAACALMMTFLVVFIILIPWACSAGYDGVKMLLFSGAQPLMHVICPLIALASFVFLQTDDPLPWQTIWLGAAPVYLYGTVATILNAARIMVGPYPFLYVYEQPIWASMLWIAALCCLGTAIAAAVWALNRRASRN